VLGDGAQVRLQAAGPAARAILVAGRPLHEPVARYGPFVMNTQEQLRQAFADYRSGRF
jgi:quercetin 2,3-dioxygenase